MKEEDKERIRKESESDSLGRFFQCDQAAFIRGASYEHPIAFNQGKIEGFNEGVEQERRDGRIEWERGYDEVKIKSFNEGVEAAKQYITSIIKLAPWADDYRDVIEKLKRTL